MEARNDNTASTAPHGNTFAARIDHQNTAFPTLPRRLCVQSVFAFLQTQMQTCACCATEFWTHLNVSSTGEPIRFRNGKKKAIYSSWFKGAPKTVDTSEGRFYHFKDKYGEFPYKYNKDIQNANDLQSRITSHRDREMKSVRKEAVRVGPLVLLPLIYALPCLQTNWSSGTLFHDGQRCCKLVDGKRQKRFREDKTQNRSGLPSDLFECVCLTSDLCKKEPNRFAVNCNPVNGEFGRPHPKDILEKWKTTDPCSYYQNDKWKNKVCSLLLLFLLLFHCSCFYHIRSLLFMHR